MKKLMYMAGLILISGSVYAACVLGRFCADDTGAAVNGQVMNGNGWVLPVLNGGQINQISNPVVGDVVVCSSCSNSATGYSLCIASSTTGTNSFVLAGSTNAVSCK